MLLLFGLGLRSGLAEFLLFTLLWFLCLKYSRPFQPAWLALSRMAFTQDV